MKTTRNFDTALIAAVTIGFMVGCAAEAPPTERETPADIATSTATPPEEASAPAQVFEGTCHALFTNAEVSEALGSPVSLRAAESYLGDFVAPARGAINCSWLAEGNRAWVSIVALPEGMITLAPDKGCVQGDPFDGPICGIDVTSNAIRMSGAAFVVEADSSTVLAAVATLETLFSSRTSGNSVPAPVLASSAWLQPVDCEALAAAVSTRAGTSPRLALIGAEVPTYDGYVLLAFSALNGGGLGCSLSSADLKNSMNVSVLGGAGWAEAQVASRSGTAEISVPGIESAYLGPVLSTGYRYLDVFDGGNWLEVFVTDADWAYTYLVPLVAELNEAH